MKATSRQLAQCNKRKKLRRIRRNIEEMMQEHQSQISGMLGILGVQKATDDLDWIRGHIIDALNFDGTAEGITYKKRNDTSL